MPRQTQFGSLNIVGELQMPAEVSFASTRITIEGYPEVPKQGRQRPFRICLVGQGTGEPVSRKSASKMKTNACQITAQTEGPCQAQRIGCVTSAESSQ